MTEADLVLAKAFLLFSVAGYTIATANANPQPYSVSQAVMSWAASVKAHTTGDRSAFVSLSELSPNPLHSQPSVSFPLYLGQRPTLFSSQVNFSGAAGASAAETHTPKISVQGFSGAPDSHSLALPPALAAAGFQFRL